jgi:hypothetical protein
MIPFDCKVRRKKVFGFDQCGQGILLHLLVLLPCAISFCSGSGSTKCL